MCSHSQDLTISELSIGLPDDAPDTPKRLQSLGEELANSISHGVGFLAVLSASPFLILEAVRRGDGAIVTGISVFAATVALLYLASTLYHAFPPGKAKRAFRVIEHSAIFLLIAGTYTPFTLGVLRGPWGWSLFGIVWGLAALGVALKVSGRAKHPFLSTLLYVGMGWTVIIAIRPLYLYLPRPGLIWLTLGGLAYTAGVGFYAAKEVRYAHFVWHLFVLAGTVCHFFTLWRYAI